MSAAKARRGALKTDPPFTRTERILTLLIPGFGFAVRGHHWPAAIGVGLNATAYLAALVFVLSFRPGAAWLCLYASMGLLLFALVESIVSRRLGRRPARGAVAIYGSIALADYGLLAVAAVLFVQNIGVIGVDGDVMSPAMESGDAYLFFRPHDADDLQRDRVIIFELDSDCTVGEPGQMIVARILAVPGDELAIRRGRFRVGEEDGGLASDFGSHGTAVDISTKRRTLTVPAECYFVVQDDRRNGLDSRVLSWARAENVVSAKLLSATRRSPLREVR